MSSEPSEKKEEMHAHGNHDNLLDKVILFLTIVVGGILIFNQFQFVNLSQNILLNAVSLLLILALIVLVVWLFLKKEHKHHAGHDMHDRDEHSAKSVKMHQSPMNFYDKLSIGLTAFV